MRVGQTGVVPKTFPHHLLFFVQLEQVLLEVILRVVQQRPVLSAGHLSLKRGAGHKKVEKLNPNSKCLAATKEVPSFFSTTKEIHQVLAGTT